MKTVTTRIPEEEDRLLQEMREEEGAGKSEVLRRLIESGLKEWRRKKALELLKQHKVTLRKAASIAGTTYVEMLDLASERGIETGYGLEELEKDLERL